VDILYVHTIPEAVFLCSHTAMARRRSPSNYFTARRPIHQRRRLYHVQPIAVAFMCVVPCSTARLTVHGKHELSNAVILRHRLACARTSVLLR
jgi:hypothetical protein